MSNEEVHNEGVMEVTVQTSEVQLGHGIINGINQFIEGLLCADAWKIPRVSPQMDGCAFVQRRTHPLNELIDAINEFPTVIARSPC